MGRKGGVNTYGKQDVARLKKNALINAKPEPTEPSTDRASTDTYTSAKSASVPSEKLPGEIVLNFLQRWSHWIAWIAFIAAGILAYANFNNDISNTKKDVVELKNDSQISRGKILDLEKSALINRINIEHISTTIDGINNEIDQTRADITRIEVMQAKQSVTSGGNTLTKPSSGQSR